MTEILCNWLNNEIGLSIKIDDSNFSHEFSTGYLIGEVLHSNGLQLDFESFSQTRSNESKLNNFTRIEPELRLLDIPFDVNIANDIIHEKPGVATRILYQLYIALTNKKKANLTGVALDTMKPRANANLNQKQSVMFKEKIKTAVPRQTDLDIQQSLHKFRARGDKLMEMSFKDRFNEDVRKKMDHQRLRLEDMEKLRKARSRTTDLCAKIQNAIVHIPKPPKKCSTEALAVKKEQRKQAAIQKTQQDITNFEDRLKQTKLHSEEDGSDELSVDYIIKQQHMDETSTTSMTAGFKVTRNDDYINKIRKRLNEDASAREEREKRRRKVLVDQLKAHEAQQEAYREEMLVARLMRQSQQERRFAVQLMQARHEKQVIRENRILREKQYEERRNQDFIEAMDMESEMANLAKLEYASQIEHDKKIHDEIAAERALARYNKHYDVCGVIVHQIVDYACKVAEYRQLTNQLIPAKIIREWTAMFIDGVPLYREAAESLSDVSTQQILEEERQKLLDEGDFAEYKEMMGEWAPGADADIKAPYRNNRILGHVIKRLFDIVYPPPPPPSPPELPEFPIKIAILGKIFAGKSSCCRRLAERHRLVVVDVQALVNEAIQAHKDGEVQEIIPPTPRESSVSLPMVTGSKSSLKSKTDLLAPSGNVAASQLLSEANTLSAPPEQAPVATDTQVLAVVKETHSSIEAALDNTVTASDKKSASIASLERVGSKAKSVESLTTSIDDKKYEPTTRAAIGARAMRCLKKGKPVEDQINVDAIMDSIRQIPDGTGWILDGFPFTYNQAKLLEKAITGHETLSQDRVSDKSSSSKSKKRSSLVADPRPSKTEVEVLSGINVVIVFDIDDELCLRRSAGRYYGSETGTQYQIEFNPPPAGSATGVGSHEKVLPVQDMSYDQDQMQQRIASFHDGWHKIEKWYSKFGIIRHVDASQDMEQLDQEMEDVLEDTMDRMEGRGKYAPVVEPEPEPVVVEEKIPTPHPTPPPAEEKISEPEPLKKPASARSRSSTKTNKAGKKDSSKEKASRGRSGSKKKSPTPEPPAEPEVPPGPPPPQPDSEEWVFVDEPIEKELAIVLAPHWENVEATYISSSKFAFRQARNERENIIRYFFQVKQDYMEYLRRIDHKQEFIDQWQKDFNEVADDTREDEEMRMELHQRVDDMRERLWSICDERKSQAEEERDAIVADGWLDDRLGLVNNHYITLMQAEVDRFQDTIRLLRDYYVGMDGKAPAENSEDYARLGLIQLCDEADMASPSAVSLVQASTPMVDEAANQSKELKSPKDHSKSPNRSSKSRTPSGKKRTGSREKQSGDRINRSPVNEVAYTASSVIGKRTKIPMVPRVMPTPDVTKEKKKGKKDDISTSDSPEAKMDLDDRLLFEAYNTAIGVLEAVIQHHQAGRDAEVAEEKKRENELLKELDAAAGGGNKKSAKKKKSASPGGKKGKKEAMSAPSPAPPPVELYTEEEKAAKALKAKKREESAFAMEEEEKACKIRLELIKLHGLGILQDLKSRAEDVYKAVFDWLGARFLSEMESIDKISEVVRHHIEKGEQVKEQLVIKQDIFIVNEDHSMTKKTPSPVVMEPTEIPGGETFTVAQIKQIFDQFLAIAPSGVMSTRSFCETFENIISVSHGMETLPDMWMSVTSQQILEIGTSLGGDLEYVDWRRFLLALLAPIPCPTQQDLLDTLESFKQMDQLGSGTVTREQFNLMPLWFTSIPPFVIPVDKGVIGPYDRLGNLRRLLFDIFADLSRTPQALDYVSMLLYFSATLVPDVGLIRALSVAAGCHMPHIFKSPSGCHSTLIHIDSSIDLDGDPTIESMPDEDIPSTAVDARVPISALHRVLHHGEKNNGDSHRFSLTGNPEDSKSLERLSHVYHELSTEAEYALLYRVLIEHPLIQDIMSACHIYTLLNLKAILNPNDFDSNSIKTLE